MRDSITLSAIAKIIGAEFSGTDKEITSMNTLKDATSSELSFVSNAKYVKDIKISNAAAIIVDEKTLKPTIENYSLGWIVSIKSPFSNKVLSVREDGKFFLKE